MSMKFTLHALLVKTDLEYLHLNFRPAWGHLLELKMRVPKTVRYHGFMATCPPHVQDTIEQTLLGTDYILSNIVSPSGIIYARHCVVGTFDVLDNSLCCIQSPFPVNGTLHDQPCILISFWQQLSSMSCGKISPLARTSAISRNWFCYALLWQHVTGLSQKGTQHIHFAKWTLLDTMCNIGRVYCQFPSIKLVR